MKVVTVIGTRPEAIKLAPVVLELNKRSDIKSVVCVTAQHRQMLDQPLELFAIEPDHDLDIMTAGQSLAGVTAKAVEGLDHIFQKEQPDWVLVQGDTTTAFSGALAAFYQRIKVGHVEAGLRTWNKWSPYPEEMNRCLVGQLADYHFAPTERSKNSLLREGFDEKNIFVTGNTVIDSLLWARERLDSYDVELPEGLQGSLEGKRVVLVTGHRRESFGEGFINICKAIKAVADEMEDVAFVYPMHLNPNVRAPVNEHLQGHDRIHLIEPLTYMPFVWLMNRADVVLTDSGGVQEEAPSLGKPVLVMRNTTERPEGVDAGNARLVGTDLEAIVSSLHELLEDEDAYNSMANVKNPYGDGTTSKQIIDLIAQAN
ncbi:MAG: UDP-N-acetylglucosamine 2-epimerase (non-hydrolyzing) [Xanthomonadales bacterium]|nr:UDP-N-acetylglucosamine 2-epimerase (non-hydrolyzing) [Xanthomonadales bacterium]